MRDYYEILDIPRDSDADAIKKAYRQLALKYHPDRNSGSTDAEERFKEATEAYEVLRDPDKRAAYDRFGHAGVKRGAGGGGFAGFNFADALEVFMRDFGGFGVEDLFGRRRGSRAGASRPRGADLRVRLPLTLEGVATGVKRTLKLRVQAPCEACAGSGAAKGSGAIRCSTCGGAGEVRQMQRSLLGQIVTVTQCPTCRGEGQVIENPCRECGGRGTDLVEKTIEVEVPPGVSSGDFITLRGSGHAGARGGPRGDILVVLEVEDDKRFARDGANLIFELGITFSQAALGAEIEVPTIGGGSARLKIASGTQSGHMLRMRGKGLPALNGGGHGDMIVRLTVWTPTDLSSREEELFRELATTESAPPPPGESDRGFWSKVKEALGGH